MPDDRSAAPLPVLADPDVAARDASGARAPDRASRRQRDATLALDGLRRVVRALRVAAGGAESATGLTAAQLFVLQAVHEAPGRSLTEIARRTMTDRTSVAAVVDRLVERALIERHRSSADRRRVELVPTAEATAVLARAPHAPTRRVLDAMAILDDRDLRRLARGLTHLARAMGLEREPATMLFEDAPSGGVPTTGVPATDAPAAVPTPVRARRRAAS